VKEIVPWGDEKVEAEGMSWGGVWVTMLDVLRGERNWERRLDVIYLK
jgi:hypothetical protein